MIEMMDEIGKLVRISVFLIYQEYELANKENLEYYERPLKSISNVQFLRNIQKTCSL